MKLKGAYILLECLREQGVDTIFGYPGGAILNVYDALYDYKDKFTHILTAHEQGAAHAADGYARSTGKTGVCFATSGPGATNLTTGIATAYMDSSPVVFITCNVNGNLIGKDSFQEIDITGISLPITKCNYLVRDVNKLAGIIREGFAIARSGRPGPVLIDIQKDVTAAECDYEFLPLEKHFEQGRLTRLADHPSVKSTEPNINDIKILADMINEAKRPLLICGGGVVRAKASSEFRELAAKIDAPVAITVMGGGAFPGGNDLKTGMIGMHGSQASNMACDACDLLLVVGSRLSDRVALDPASFASQAKIAQIDIDAAEIDKNVKTSHYIIGDAKKILASLLNLVNKASHDDWKKYVFSFKTETEYDDAEGGALTPKQILSAVEKILPKDIIVSTDVGQHQMWAIQHLKFSYPGQLITSGGFGTMGFGLGAAIGAQVGNPDKKVLHVAGDGSFRMNCNELATEEFYKLPIITLIFNNSTLGMVRQWQNLIYNKHFSYTTLDRGPDFVKLAQAYGLNGYRAANISELESALKDALASNKGSVIDCIIDIDEMVRPMVSGGAHISDFLLA
ncbi:MAG: biosynthetic-type acetolactate synthase large subunit [Synergistaceae bacterium]|nr:biosynthetic-type acetolactate synthase large subunit [Synergistaceae bacterium]MBR1602743.1 biosynthetic-type acetolactate synthase large subunit [Synergistaceae bacterium]